MIWRLRYDEAAKRDEQELGRLRTVHANELTVPHQIMTAVRGGWAEHPTAIRLLRKLLNGVLVQSVSREQGGTRDPSLRNWEFALRCLGVVAGEGRESWSEQRTVLTIQSLALEYVGGYSSELGPLHSLLYAAFTQWLTTNSSNSGSGGGGSGRLKAGAGAAGRKAIADEEATVVVSTPDWLQPLVGALPRLSVEELTVILKASALYTPS